MLDGAESDPLSVVSEAPQGSILGPLLYINGVSNTVLHGKITMYADDIALNLIIKNPSDYTYLQSDITALCSWLATNHLTHKLAEEIPLTKAEKRNSVAWLQIILLVSSFATTVPSALKWSYK